VQYLTRGGISEEAQLGHPRYIFTAILKKQGLRLVFPFLYFTTSLKSLQEHTQDFSLAFAPFFAIFTKQLFYTLTK
jgi:hypothetical protein